MTRATKAPPVEAERSWVWPKHAAYERLPKGHKKWEPCPMTTVRMALGALAKRVERGEELVSEHGVRYRRAAVMKSAPPSTKRERRR